jgi:hypothetical protein
MRISIDNEVSIDRELHKVHSSYITIDDKSADLTEQILIIPASTSYTTAALSLATAPILTYITVKDKSNNTGLNIRFNGATDTSFKLDPDLLLEEVITSVSINNTSSDDKVVIFLQATGSVDYKLTVN